MSKFNKLYNLIIENIIVLNKESRRALLKKSGFDNDAIQHIFKFLSKFNNKTADFLCKYVADKTLTKVNDHRIKEIEKILEFNNNIDTQRFQGTMDLFIQLYKEKTDKLHEKRYSKTSKYIKQFPQLKEVRSYDNGVKIYKVLDSKEGQLAVRKIIDVQWREDANPWCLVSRKNDEEHEDDLHFDTHWKHYSSYPKHIAFQDGKLLAFYASNRRHEPKWWNRLDLSSTDLPLLDGSYMYVDVLDWDKDDMAQKFTDLLKFYINTKQLWKNLNGVWDGKGQIKVSDEFLYENRFPIQFGTIDGDFICSFNNLTTLLGGPKKVTGSFACSQCHSLTSLVGAPLYVGKSFYCHNCEHLKTLEGAPKYVGGNFECESCYKITSTKGMPKEVGGDIIFDRCSWLMDLRYIPKNFKGELSLNFCWNIPYVERYKQKLWKDPLTGLYNSRGNIVISENDLVDHKFPIKFGKINGDFKCSNLSSLYSLLGGPTEVKNNFICNSCLNLKSLEHSPKYVGGYFECTNTGIKNLKGVTQNIGKFLEASYNDDLLSLEGAPQELDGPLIINNCVKLKNLIGAPRKCAYLACNRCHGLESFEGAPRKIERFIECHECENLRDLKGLANTDVKRIYCRDCFHLEYSLDERFKYGIVLE